VVEFAQVFPLMLLVTLAPVQVVNRVSQVRFLPRALGGVRLTVFYGRLTLYPLLRPGDSIADEDPWRMVALAQDHLRAGGMG
jgi:hypothetical protein